MPSEHYSPPLVPCALLPRSPPIGPLHRYASLERSKVYFFGIIDVLEKYSLRWKAQNLLLTAAYYCALRSDASHGISALPPNEYAERFVTFAVHEALQLRGPPADTAVMLRETDDAGSSGGAIAPPLAEPSSPTAARRGVSSSAAAAAPVASYTAESYGRWRHLWQRRRRGLVKMRIEDDRADHLRRIAELEHELEGARAHGQQEA